MYLREKTTSIHRFLKIHRTHLHHQKTILFIYTGKTQLISRCNDGSGINTLCRMAAHVSSVYICASACKI